ncbi:hypothetical protein TG4357_01948 [Thalassovita gelatinovora]|uniref:Uncharacterized protein n=1 Tax=Thalassovita gelatinovora TaxID=53501 RepID=A0A0P1FBS3_THAGE|nr:hypothetical protein TG4357_01948 [Thalassovita gelatinovora]SER07250.1 hypothetical protein SAMN04488043_1152 [Thalassovita gelatinovora]
MVDDYLKIIGPGSARCDITVIDGKCIISFTTNYRVKVAVVEIDGAKVVITIASIH